jgi:hypothetical protein
MKEYKEPIHKSLFKPNAHINKNVFKTRDYPDESMSGIFYNQTLIYTVE